MDAGKSITKSLLPGEREASERVGGCAAAERYARKRARKGGRGTVIGSADAGGERTVRRERGRRERERKREREREGEGEKRERASARFNRNSFHIHSTVGVAQWLACRTLTAATQVRIFTRPLIFAPSTNK